MRTREASGSIEEVDEIGYLAISAMLTVPPDFNPRRQPTASRAERLSQRHIALGQTSPDL